MENVRGTTLVAVLSMAFVLPACAKSNVLSPSGVANVAPPTLDAPADDQQLTTLRPTLTVRNATSSQAGTRTYEFQVADNPNFSPVAVSKAGVAEDASGRTGYSPDLDLQSATRFYWRSRAVQGTAISNWSATGRFRTRIVGFSRPGALYDPLIDESLGTRVGSTTFVPGKGLRIESETSYLYYQLPQTVSSGEFSMEVEGLRANGPGQKLKIFSMMDGTGDLISSRYQLSAQYRGVNGNPNNCISIKAVWGYPLCRDFRERLLHE